MKYVPKNVDWKLLKAEPETNPWQYIIYIYMLEGTSQVVISSLCDVSLWGSP